MSESLRDLVVSLSLQTDNFTRNIKSVNKQIKEAESNFKLAGAGVEDFEKTAAGLSSHLSTLERKLTLQQQAVSQYEKALQAADSKLTECYNRQKDYARRLEQARAAQLSLKEQVREAAAQLSEYNRTLGESDPVTEAAHASLEDLKTQYREAVQEVKKLAGQNTALQKSTLNAADAVTTAQTNLNNASSAVKVTEADITKCNAALALAETNWEQASQAIKNSENALSGIGQQIRLAQSQFTLAVAEIKDIDSSAEGLTSRLSMLEERFRLQSNAVTQYQNILRSTREQLLAANQANDPDKIEQATRAITEAEIALNQAKTSVKQTEQEINACSQALNLANTAWYTAGESITQAQNSIAGIGNSLQSADAQFRLATAGMQNLETSASGMLLKAEHLESKWRLLEDAVVQYRIALLAAYDQLDAAYEANDSAKVQEAHNAVQQASTALDNAKAAAAEARAELEHCRDELDLFADGWYDAGDSMDRSKRSLNAIGKQLQQAQNKFRLSVAGIKDLDKSAQGLSAKLALLKEKFHLQRKAVEQYEHALAAAQIRLKAAQNANDPDKIQKATDEVIEARTELSNANATLAETKAEIESCNRALKTAQSAWTAAGKELDDFGRSCDKVSKGMSTAGRVLTTVMTTPIVGLGAAAVKASISFESAFTSVRKTVVATEDEFAQLSGEIKQMSTEVGSSADDIAEVVAIAGQLGIANEYLTEFARTMIDLGNSTDIVAEEAASTLAKFANITGMDQSQFSNLGATLVDLGNNYATTESAIMNMAMRLAAAGNQVGLSESQILGFAAALSSVGIEAEMGGSAFSKALIKMEVAAATGGQALDDFAKVSGLTSEAFKALWDSDPAGAFQAFIEGLAKMDDEGMSAIATLDEIGIAEIRLRDTLLRAVNANELFTETQATANEAWDDNAALTEEANKRYATTASKLSSLKNKAMLFGQTLGDDLNPTIQELISGASDLLDQFMELDEAQRMQIIKFAAIAAATGPVLLGFGKITKGIGTISTGIGKFATAVGKAGGGFKGFMSVLGKSPAVWLAIAAAAITATVAIYDYASGAKQAREALEGMTETAEKWKNTAANTFYGKGGLSFFGMSKDDFTRDVQSAQEWMTGLLAVWTDGQKETDDIVSTWTESFKALTAATRTELEQMRTDAQNAGYTGVVDQLTADIETLDSMDAEIEALLKKRQNGYFTEADQIRLQELLDTREAIEIKYHLSPADTDGFDTIRDKVEAEVARAHARGQDDADVIVYERAMVAAAEGLAAMNDEIDAQYDKEYALIQLIEDSTERQAAMDDLNARYNENRRNAAREYATLMADIVLPVWEQSDIQQAATDVDLLTQKLREYSAAAPDEKPALLEEINALTSGMDETALTEYIAMLMQIQSLMDNGMDESEVQALFPNIDFSTALEQIAAIQAFLNNHDSELPGLASMFGEALPEEVLTIATDLDMTGAQARWAEFAANPGAITTDAVIAQYTEDQNTIKIQPTVDAFIAKYTEIPEGASIAELTPDGLIAYVSTFAEATTGADVSGLTPENVTAMVSAYEELAAGADVSALTPDEITAYITKYLEAEGVDMTGLTPDGITAFVLAYEEVEGGALTTSLTPDDVVAMVGKYLEAENVDLSALSTNQIEAIVAAFAEATGCDKSQLLQGFTAYITAYDDTNAVKPTLSITVGITGYDLIAYRNFIDNNAVEVEGIVRLGDVYDTPTDALKSPDVTFWQNGVEIPVSAVPEELLTADKLAVLAEDGTIHVFITPKLTGSDEAISEARDSLGTKYTYGDSIFGKVEIAEDSPFRFLATDTFSLIKTQTIALKGMIENDNTFGDLWGLLDGLQVHSIESRLETDFDPTRIGELSAYVSEVVTAIQTGKEVSEEDLANLQAIVEFLSLLQLTDTGENIRAGIAEGMTSMGWDTDAETVASDLETALNTALGIQSPSTRVKPVGENISAGIGVGMTGYAFTSDASSVATNIQGAVNTSINATTLRSAGVNAMAGLRNGIIAGRSGVISAMRSAARAAVNAAKAELQIHSPSAVFEDEIGVQAMKGFGVGILKESKEQARIIRNASRYLTDEARESAIVNNNSDNRHTYNQNVSSTIQVDKLYVRDEQDIRSLAVEIATLTRRQQRGKGMRLA